MGRGGLEAPTLSIDSQGPGAGKRAASPALSAMMSSTVLRPNENTKSPKAPSVRLPDVPTKMSTLLSHARDVCGVKLRTSPTSRQV